MHPVIKQLTATGPVVLDGAWGTELQARGLPVGVLPDIWNVDNPQAVWEVARSYVEAGSQIILTNTFGANRFNLKRYGLDDRLEAINRQGVAISKKAANGKAKVFASVGPSGAMLVLGEITNEELENIFGEQTAILAEAGADGIVVETMSDLTEAQLAVRAAKRTGLPVVACMAFQAGKNFDRTIMGVSCAQAAQGLLEAGADVIGANCGRGIESFVDLLRQFRQVTLAPVWLKPNAGMPELVEGRPVYRTLPEEFAAHVPQLVAEGAQFIGGCCGTNPEFVRAICRALGRSAAGCA
ncbi:MAG: homocysteine S-methyltransferase family protein [Thermoguttaceae bacterium]|nr:homocysteine S-methyltransferase family protein [Thermoguttaceae bacterium]MDW8079647.1 homocysteine S-methyltransferase family protein [Thermoguttaceae bacterium]